MGVTVGSGSAVMLGISTNAVMLGVKVGGAMRVLVGGIVARGGVGVFDVASPAMTVPGNGKDVGSLIGSVAVSVGAVLTG